LAERLEKLTEGGDPLVKLREIIPWESFRRCIQKALKKHKKTNAGRKPFDYVMMFKILVLQALYNLSDHQIEYFDFIEYWFKATLSLSLWFIVSCSLEVVSENTGADENRKTKAKNSVKNIALGF
jgi:IS5 family transposase